MANTSENLKIENEGEESQSKETISTYNKAIEIAAQMHAANRLFEEKIGKVSELIKDYKTANNAYNPEAADEAKQEKAKEIDNISIKLYKEQSLGLIYANEAYYSAGPVLHIVGEMQIGLGKISTPVEYLQSLMMQIGYKLQHIEHYQHLFHDISDERQKAAKLDRVGYLFAKYGHRAIEALNEVNKSLEDAGIDIEMSQTTARTIMADLAMEYVKKSSTGTPNERRIQAVEAGGSVSQDLIKGENLDLEVMKSSWKELAIKVVARMPHFLN